MNIAIFGATSQIAKDLIESFANQTSYKCTLFSRDVSAVQGWLKKVGIYKDYRICDYSGFSLDDSYDVIINFVGIGNPAQAKEMGSSILDVTYLYDTMVLNYLTSHPDCKYLFLSSGAVYGGDFAKPVTNESVAIVPVNDLNETNWYAIAKLYAEAKHRALPEYAIVDIRVFNYFSHTQDMDANFFITDLVRALQRNDIFKTSDDNIVRDFITPPDFFNLIQSIVDASPRNMSVDCYTKEPVDKLALLEALMTEYGLKYEFTESLETVNATGLKMNYFSMRKTAAELGYAPQKTSIDGIVEQINLL